MFIKNKGLLPKGTKENCIRNIILYLLKSMKTGRLFNFVGLSLTGAVLTSVMAALPAAAFLQ